MVKRFLGLDIARALALILMIIYHILFILNFYSIKSINVSSGVWKGLGVLAGLKVRDEGEQHVIYAHDRFLVAPEGVVKLVSAISQKGGLTVDSKLASDANAVRTIGKCIDAGVLKNIGG